MLLILLFLSQLEKSIEPGDGKIVTLDVLDNLIPKRYILRSYNIKDSTPQQTSPN
jgi:hypothetical protein